MYNEFMKEYYKQHAVYPKCGASSHQSTLVGYTFNPAKPDDYKDLNKCICKNCKDNHIYHDRISLAEFNKLNGGN